MKLNCIIIEDEPLAQDVLKKYISDLPSLELAGIYSDAVSAQQELHAIKPDLIFLDINLPILSGVNFLRSLTNPPAVIFTTAYQDFALEGFELNAVDYLLKPFSFERFLKAVNKVQEKLASKPVPGSVEEAVFIKVDKRLVRVPFNDIHYLEALDDYVKVVSQQKTYLTNNSLRNLYEQLPAARFLRVHKSFVVSTSMIEYIEGNYMKLADKEIPIGAAYKDEVTALFKGKKKT
jgi:DNA-binding LytR/AlgR family response regulator